MNWIRWNEVRIVAASVLTAVVLASPGSPSIRMCPSQSSPISIRSISSRCPTTTFSISARIRRTTTISFSTCWVIS